MLIIKKLYGSGKQVKVFDIKEYLIADELKIFVTSKDPLLLNWSLFDSFGTEEKPDIILLIKKLSLNLAKEDIYLSPLSAINHLSDSFFIINEGDIYDIFNFLIAEILPIFKFKEEYIALIIYDIFRTDWYDEESKYAFGEYFLRNYFMKNSLSQHLGNNDFSKKFVNYLYERLNWHNHAFSYKDYNQRNTITREQYDRWDYNGDILEELREQENNKADYVFKNAMLLSNLKGSISSNIKFQYESRFEKSLNQFI